MPPGGTTGQILAKTSSADYATAWQAPSGGGGITLPLTQNLTFSPDNTYDIGASAANRPRNVYVGGSGVFSQNVAVNVNLLFGTLSSNQYMTWYSATTVRLVTQDFMLSGDLTWDTDNAKDIGSSSSGPGAKPRTVYVGTSLLTPTVQADTYAWGQSAPDTYLVRDAAYTLAQRNGINAETLRIYSGYTGPADYERLAFNTGTFDSILTEQAGSGSARTLMVGTTGAQPLIFRTNNTNRWQVDPNGHLTAYADNTYDIGASGASRPRNVWIAGTGQFSGRVGIGQAPSADEFLVVNGNVSVMNAAGFGGGYQGGVAITVNGSNYNHGLWSKASVRAGGNGWLIDQVRVDGVPTSGGFTGVDYRSFYIGAIAVGAGFATNYALYIGNPSGATTSIGLYNEGTTQLNGLVGVNGAPSASVLTKWTGLGTTSATYGLLHVNSGGTNVFYTRDDGLVLVQGTLQVIGNALLPVGVIGTQTIAANAVQQQIASYEAAPTWSTTAGPWVESIIQTNGTYSGAQVRVEISVCFTVSALAKNTYWAIGIDGSVQKTFAYAQSAAANQVMSVAGTLYITPTVGAHRISVFTGVDSGGTLTLSANCASTLFCTEQKR